MSVAPTTTALGVTGQTIGAEVTVLYQDRPPDAKRKIPTQCFTASCDQTSALSVSPRALAPALECQRNGFKSILRKKISAPSDWNRIFPLDRLALVAAFTTTSLSR